MMFLPHLGYKDKQRVCDGCFDVVLDPATWADYSASSGEGSNY